MSCGHGFENKGFALVSTLVVMILLMVIGIGVVTMSAQQSKISAQDRYQMEAQSNARLALMMAISKLQETMGPDQRVSAEADILGSEGFAGWDRADSKKHLVGVYSSEVLNERDSSGLFSYWQPYEKDRNKEAFVGWLLSGDESKLDELEFAKGEFSEENLVTLLGEGTLGKKSDDSEYIEVPPVALEINQKVVGRYAWVALDEGVKANVVPNKKDESSFSADQRSRISWMSQDSTGTQALDGYEKVKISENEVSSLITRNQLELIGDSLESEVVEESYFDTTVHSRSVLSDVVRGGLRRDLSLPFELPSNKADSSASDWSYELNQADSIKDRPSYFSSIWEFNNSGDQNSDWRHARMNMSGYRPYWWSKKMGYVFAYPEGGGRTDRTGNKRYLRGPSWDLLRSHYRLYKRDLESKAASHRDRRGVRAPSTERSWLARPYEPYSFRTDSMGHTLLSHTYVGESLTVGGGYSSNSVWDPFYSYGSAIPASNRPWNNMGFTSYGIAPVLTKFTLVFSVLTEPYRGKKRLSVCVDAVGNLWNPYNVPVEAEAVFTQLNLNGLRWSMECKRSSGATEQWASEPGKGYGADMAFPFKHIRIGVANKEPGQARPGSNLVLMPGEVRSFALDFGAPKPYSYAQLYTEPGKFTNNWSGGYRLYHSDKWLLENGDSLKFILKPDDSQRSTFSTVLGYFEQLHGAPYNPFDTNGSGNLIDQPEISSVHINKSSEMVDDGKFEVSLSNIPVGISNKKAIASLEFRRLAADEASYGIATQIDPRSITNHAKAMGDGPGIPDGWTAKISKVSDFDLLQNGIGSRNNGFWGSSHDGSGETHVVYYDVPDSPLVSLGAFQSCQMGSTGWSSPYTIGSSFPHPKITQDKLIKEVSQSRFKNVFYDMPYLVNSTLWDRYFLSGLYLEGQYDESSGSAALKEAEEKMQEFVDTNGQKGLANLKLSLASSAYDKGERLIPELTHYRWMARNLMLDGGFNVNSTRKEAWKAWLSSIYKKDVAQVNKENGSVSVGTSANEASFSRLTVPAGGDGEEWGGYVSLSDQEIDSLADAIVEQVKIRGPFLSVGDFVNRRLAKDDTGKSGALESAIEKALTTSDYGSGNQRGITGKIRQSDILTGLGNVLVARSDTFVIRAYGESVDPKTGRVRAKSWCEAVVQRQPDLFNDDDKLSDAVNPEYDSAKDPAGVDPFIVNPDLSQESKKYGRRFNIVSFRWLNNDEI